jgi:hypothetical protein
MAANNTIGDIVTAAFRRIGAWGLGEVNAPTEMDDGLRVLDDMLTEWKLRGVEFELWSPGLAKENPFGIPREYHEGVIQMLAARLAPGYGQASGFDAEEFFRALQAQFTVLEPVTLDTAVSIPNSSLTWRQY